ncbi:MAG: response regulator [Planctomycetota bacterium]|nr:response regulator [Planctomycetota bacterium]
MTAPSKTPGGAAAAGFLSPAPQQSPDEDERPAPRRRPPPPPSPVRCHVLLIEDDATSANALRVLLTMHGCEVAVARSLERGLDLLRTNPSAIVVDLMLPDGDGIEILTRVREANLPIKVVVTTAVGDPARLAAVHRLKPECVLRKPIDLGELLRAIGVA